MFTVIAALVAMLAVGGFVWSHDASVAKDARDKQFAADKAAYEAIVADRDLAKAENAKMKGALDAYAAQVREQEKVVAAMADATEAMRRQKAAAIVKQQPAVIQRAAEIVDLDAALQDRHDNLTCQQQLADTRAMLASAIGQQHRDHPLTPAEAKSIFGIDKPVTIRPPAKP